MTIEEIIVQLSDLNKCLLLKTREADTTHGTVMKIASAMGKIDSACVDLKEMVAFPVSKRLPGK